LPDIALIKVAIRDNDIEICKEKTVDWFLLPKNIRSFCCIYSSSTPFRSSIHVNLAPVMAYSENRSNDLGGPAIRADFFCPN
jgi:hypothetical protein